MGNFQIIGLFRPAEAYEVRDALVLDGIPWWEIVLRCAFGVPKLIVELYV